MFALTPQNAKGESNVLLSETQNENEEKNTWEGVYTRKFNELHISTVEED